MKITKIPFSQPKWHIYPRNDLREHIVDDEEECWCHPIENEEGFIVHNSMDGREQFETGERKLS